MTASATIPENAREELLRFPQIYAQALADVEDLIAKANAPENGIVQQQRPRSNTDTHSERVVRYKLSLSRALALLEDGRPD